MHLFHCFLSVFQECDNSINLVIPINRGNEFEVEFELLDHVDAIPTDKNNFSVLHCFILELEVWEGVLEEGWVDCHLIFFIELPVVFIYFVRVAQNIGIFELRYGHFVEGWEFLLFWEYLFE